MYPNISFTQSSITWDKEASKATTVSQTVAGPQRMVGPFFFPFSNLLSSSSLPDVVVYI